METEKLLQKFVDLVQTYGVNGRFYTFDYCADYGVELNGSAIDSICFRGGYGGIAFYYNENTGDYDMFGDFNIEDLETFYHSLVRVITEKENEEEPKQYTITITADEGRVADSLRKIATWIEENGEDYPYDYEDADCCATITEA